MKTHYLSKDRKSTPPLPADVQYNTIPILCFNLDTLNVLFFGTFFS